MKAIKHTIFGSVLLALAGFVFLMPGIVTTSAQPLPEITSNYLAQNSNRQSRPKKQTPKRRVKKQESVPYVFGNLDFDSAQPQPIKRNPTKKNANRNRRTHPPAL